MIRVILETPYAGEVGRNVMYARFCMRDCLLLGEAPFASHLLYTQPHVLDDLDPTERSQGILAGFSWRESADYTVVYTDLGISNGMERGISHSHAMNRPVFKRKLPPAAFQAFERAYNG